MPIDPIGAVSAAQPAGYLPNLASTRAGSNDADGFAAALTGAVDNLQSLNGQKDTLGVQAVTGDLDDIHNATIAATRASTTLDLLVGVRNKAVDGFNEIMRMQA